MNRPYACWTSKMAHKDTDDIKNVDNMINHEQLFRDWITHPKILLVQITAAGNAAALRVLSLDDQAPVSGGC